MNREEAKQVLLLYRPGTADAADPKIAEAKSIAERDPELGQWLRQHEAFQNAMRTKLRQIEVPEHLKARLLARDKIIEPPVAWWRKPSPFWLAAAAVFVVVLGLAAFWLKPAAPNQFANFQERMVSEVLRQYRMDTITNDPKQLRQFIASRGAPADYEVPQGLERLQLTGGGVLSWRNHPVSMVCYDRGDKQMLFLFVLKRSAVKDPPPPTPSLAKVRDLDAVSWTEGDNTYVLAGPAEADFAKKYL